MNPGGYELDDGVVETVVETAAQTESMDAVMASRGLRRVVADCATQDQVRFAMRLREPAIAVAFAGAERRPTNRGGGGADLPAAADSAQLQA